MAQQITVEKRDHLGRTVTSYTAIVVGRLDDGIILHARWRFDARDLGFVVLQTDDHWIETFYENRWYSLFEIRNVHWQLKGWYCNISRPAMISPQLVAADDLALDLWVPASGPVRILDEDEFRDLPITPSERREAESALVDLLTMVRRQEPPFQLSQPPWSRCRNRSDPPSR